MDEAGRILIRGVPFCRLTLSSRTYNILKLERMSSVYECGTFTVDAQGAVQVAKAIGARLIIPMHFKTDKCDLPLIHKGWLP